MDDLDAEEWDLLLDLLPSYVAELTEHCGIGLPGSASKGGCANKETLRNCVEMAIGCCYGAASGCRYLQGGHVLTFPSQESCEAWSECWWHWQELGLGPILHRDGVILAEHEEEVDYGGAEEH